MAKYIDADEFYEGFCIYAIGQDKNFIKAVEQVLEDTPTADVEEVRHGEWVLDEERYVRRVRQERLTKFVTFRCSECGQRKARNIRFKYCPNCGAKMDRGNAE